VRVALLSHHGKEEGIGQALERADFEFCHPESFDYDVVMADSDHPQAVPAPWKHNVLKECAKRGIPIVLFPHGAPPDLDYDGLRKLELPISMRLVHGEGHAEVARRMRCRHRVEVVGWTFSEVAEPPVSLPAASLLFAPIHPWANGHDILPFHKGLNTAAYYQFLQHPAERKTVRMFGADAPNGIVERVEGVEYQQTDLGNGIAVIDNHDAVISYGTFAYQALARGKPTAMIYAYPGHTDDYGNVQAKRFDEYKDYLKYPANLADGTLDEVLQMDVSEWKRLFVGESLDEDRLVSLLKGFKANRAQRRKLAKLA
jgi:hypothetical protein